MSISFNPGLATPQNRFTSPAGQPYPDQGATGVPSWVSSRKPPLDELPERVVALLGQPPVDNWTPSGGFPQGAVSPGGVQADQGAQLLPGGRGPPAAQHPGRGIRVAGGERALMLSQPRGFLRAAARAELVEALRRALS